MNKKVGIIVSARIDSSRLPGKALKLIQGKPMLEFLLLRLKESQIINEFIFATTKRENDDLLSDLAIRCKYKVFRGSTNNLIDRYVGAAKRYNLDIVIRVTGDCPFVNGEMIDFCLNHIKNRKFDLASTKGLFPKGLDIEIYNCSIMERISSSELLSEDDKEHLTLFFYKNIKKYNILYIKPPSKWVGALSYTVDTPEDYKNIVKIANNFANPCFSIDEIVNLENHDY